MILYKEKKNCCGCGACENICPVGAISMKPDEYGFLYPEIDANECIECGLCKMACGFQNPGKWRRQPIGVFAAVNRKESVLGVSASGGAFGAIANVVIEKGGKVYGCEYDKDMKAIHGAARTLEEMKGLHGSKYVQSEIGRTFSEVKEDLSNGKWVFFTGTPRQVAGLRAFLDKDYGKLITADLVCYGVPSPDFFKGQVESLEKELGGKITDFRFRDKENGWASMRMRLVYEKDGKIIEKSYDYKDLPYYDYFVSADIFRESCYACPFARPERSGDFTIGDFWGIEEFHPEVHSEKGVSVIFANNQKAISLIEELKKEMLIFESDLEKACHSNGCLRQPVEQGLKRENVFSAWKSGGWQAVENMNKKGI